MIDFVNHHYLQNQDLFLGLPAPLCTCNSGCNTGHSSLHRRNSCCTISSDRYIISRHSIPFNSTLWFVSMSRRANILNSYAGLCTILLEMLLCVVQIYTCLIIDSMYAKLVNPCDVIWTEYQVQVYTNVFLRSVFISWLLVSIFDKFLFENWMYTCVSVKLIIWSQDTLRFLLFCCFSCECTLWFGLRYWVLLNVPTLYHSSGQSSSACDLSIFSCSLSLQFEFCRFGIANTPGLRLLPTCFSSSVVVIFALYGNNECFLTHLPYWISSSL